MILVFVLVPGLPGAKIYTIVMGRNWREDNWDKALKLVAFSVLGLALYSVVGLGLGAPSPTYLTIQNLEGALQSSQGTFALFFALLGHAVGSGIAGFAAGQGYRILASKFGFVPDFNIWDFFVRKCVPQRWILVSLSNGEAYAGRLETAEISVQSEERDLILDEPAKYSEETGGYIVLPYQHLYLPGSLVSSVTTLADPIEDDRLTTIGEILFQGDEK